jgi:hypothetical protein
MSNAVTVGLRQQILGAQSKEEVATLLVKGETYDLAADSTRRQWKSAARRRIASLKGEVAPPVVVEEQPVVSEEFVSAKKNRKKRL